MYTEDSMGLRESHWSPLVSLGLWWSSLVFKSLASAGVCLAGLQESPLCGSSVHVRVLLERSPLCTTYSASLWGGMGGDLYVVPALVCGLTGSHRFHWSAVVVDEAHRLKNAASKLHQTLSAVSVERGTMQCGESGGGSTWCGESGGVSTWCGESGGVSVRPGTCDSYPPLFMCSV